MNNLAMEQLVEQVPELKLRKHVETRTIHWSDVRENKSLKEGDVIECVSWVSDNGFQWTRLHMIEYIMTRNCLDSIMVEESINAGELVL